MKALILSGGKGTRLRPFTHSLSKQLVPVANKPVLVHCLENIRATGIREIGIIVGDNGDEIQQALGTGPPDLDVELTYITQEEPLGLAHCVLIARDFLGDDDFVMYLGDNILADGIVAPIDRFRTRRPHAQILVTPVDDPRAYGVAEVTGDGVVTRLVEKPSQPRSDLAITGVYALTPAIYDAIDAIEPSGRGELEITDALQYLVSAGATVTVERYDGYWQDTGSIDGLLESNRVLLSAMRPEVRGTVDDESYLRGDVTVEPGATVSRSQLVGPLVVGRNAVVTDSYLGPGTSVSHDCLVQDASVANSILLEGAYVDGVKDLRRSIIGRWAEVRSSTNHDDRRLILGDHSRAEVIAVAAPRFNELSENGRASASGAGRGSRTPS